MTDQKPPLAQESDLGTRPLVVVDWEYIEPAARELFTIWHEHHDLKWARYAWSRLEKVRPDVDGEGEQVANSVVLLVGLAMLSSAFWDAAWEDPGDPQYVAADALTAIGLDRFYIGQLWPWLAPQAGWAKPDINKILCALTKTAAEIYARRVLNNMGTAEVVQYFESVPFLDSEAAAPRMSTTRRTTMTTRFRRVLRARCWPGGNTKCRRGSCLVARCDHG